MITHISIKDFAIIQNISLDFQRGLHVLTGETGAGKSIIIEAVSMALGSRADTTYVRSGQDKAIIQLVAELEDPAALSLLSDNGFGEESTVYIQREIFAGGKSLCRVNGTLVSLTFLSSFCKKIADIHGQYDHQSLLDPESHIFLLDNYDRKFICPAKEKAALFYQEYTRLYAERNQIADTKAETLRNRDFMQYELSEINSAKPVAGEDETLAEQLLLLSNSETLYSTLSRVYELLFEQADSSRDSLGKSAILLDEIKNFSGEYAYFAETLSECCYKLEDLQTELRRAKDSITFSPEAINDTMERMDLLDRLKKKYGGTLERVLSYRLELEEKLALMENFDQRLESLEKQMKECETQLRSACEDLTELRMKAAEKMERDMARELADLNFQSTHLTVSITPLGSPDKPKYTEMGWDQVEFLIVTNKGEQPKPLSKIASGGEISRIMLAFKSILGDTDKIPTLIFDEIDSGISGVTASIVGKKMKEISGNHQVICITHLPQIAAFSDHHYQISKEESEGRSVTLVKPLSSSEKIYEIARMLGGLHVTETTLKNAEELISQSVV